MVLENYSQGAFYIIKKHYSNFCIFENASLVNVPGHYLKKCHIKQFSNKKILNGNLYMANIVNKIVTRRTILGFGPNIDPKSPR